MSDIRVLKRMAFFKNLKDADLEEIKLKLEKKVYQKGELIFSKGSIGSEIYLIESGSVEVFRQVDNKSEDAIVSLKILYEGNFFGEMALFDERERSASIQALEETVIYMISRKVFFEICHKHQDVLFELFRLMTIRFREFNEQYTTLWNKVTEAKKLNAIGTTTSKIIHDLKAPLTAIHLSTQMLMNSKMNLDKNINRIMQQTEYAHKMVMSILDIAKESEKEIKKDAHKISDFFDVISSLLQPQIEKKKINLVIEQRGGETANFDRLNLQRAFMNILVNAIEAIESDKGELRIVSEINDQFWVVKISDNGPGIPQEILHKIFDPFFSVGKANGTGFGLAITKKIVVLHNGSLKAGNNEDKGAYFEIKIPV